MMHFLQHDSWLADLENALYQNISNMHLTAELLAEVMGMSRPHFYRKVRDLTQLTPRAYILNKRLNYAQQLLEKGELKSVKAVAHAVGIQKVRYFSEQFKGRFGQLPSEFLT